MNTERRINRVSLEKLVRVGGGFDVDQRVSTESKDGLNLLGRTVDCSDEADGVEQLFSPLDGGRALELEGVTVDGAPALRRIVGEELTGFRICGGRKKGRRGGGGMAEGAGKVREWARFLE